MNIKFVAVILSSFSIISCAIPKKQQTDNKKEYSGIYPHLAYYNNEGECGTGAVVPWADRLWVITYAPHKYRGSSDKLYEITPDLQQHIREESVGGTPANRLIHDESNQLFIGPYAIDKDRNVRVLSYADAPGRYTGAARHLTDAANKLYIATMEEGLYEVDVHTLTTNTIYQDGNVLQKKSDKVGDFNSLLPGAHGKGLYSGQGVVVYSNNGEGGKEARDQFDIEAGVLAEWDGKDWKVVRRNQFVEVTGPGGIHGNAHPDTDPIWATGWDYKSLIIGVRSADEGWKFYRLPKASHSYDGAHGWNTEWPRIRDIGTPQQPDYLMTMHGMFWRFPSTFSTGNTAGIRPRSAYLKVVGDFTRWNDHLVFGTDDSAEKEFLNKRKAKGDIAGPGQSNSNLWFTSLEKPDELGETTSGGAVWLKEEVANNAISEPFLFAGWKKRQAWVLNEGKQAVNLQFEVDVKGDNNWQRIKQIEVKPNQTVNVLFDPAEKGEWIRVRSSNKSLLTVHFTYSEEPRSHKEGKTLFNGLAKTDSKHYQGGLLYALGENRRSLAILAHDFKEGQESVETGYYELDGNMNLVKKEDVQTSEFIRNKMAIPKQVVTIDERSVLVVDDRGRRWRLPLGSERYTEPTNNGELRIVREVATERDLMNIHGTFYELPAENADGFAKIRPIASHDFRIHDFASYRGLLVMTGIDDHAENDHIIRSEDGKAKVWAGAIDDLWAMGKPVGIGGPWKNSLVKAAVPSDPYLIGFYDQKMLKLSHDKDVVVTFKIQTEPVGHGPWMDYKEIIVAPGETIAYVFPDTFQSRWIRFVTDKDCSATAFLTYR